MKLIIIAVITIAVIAISGLFTTREVNTRIEINASAQQVWTVLSDFRHYDEWNPFIIRIDGTATAGSPLAVTINPAVGGKMDFNLLVQRVISPQEMIWRGETLMPNLLDGEHFFRIESLSAERVVFSQGERYNGALLFFSWPIIHWSVNRSFNDMNTALKERVETVTTKP